MQALRPAVHHRTPALQQAGKIVAAAAPAQPERSQLDDPRIAFTPPRVIGNDYAPLMGVWRVLDELVQQKVSLCNSAYMFYANFQQNPYFVANKGRQKVA